MKVLKQGKHCRSNRISHKNKFNLIIFIVAFVFVLAVLSGDEIRGSGDAIREFFSTFNSFNEKSVKFTQGDDDVEWAELEAMRWERADSWDDSKALMMHRLALLRKMIRSSKRLKILWDKELQQLRPFGIVMTAGGQEQLTNAYASMLVLRNVTQSNLPVAVCHYGDEIPERSKTFISKRVKYVEFVDLATFPFPDYHLPIFDGYGAPRSREEGYMVKILAIRAAPFREIIYIDTDSFPLDKPETLFKLSEYKERGNIFWPDLWRGKTHLHEFFEMEKQSPWYRDGDLGAWRDRVGKYFNPDKDKWKIKEINSEPLPPRQAEAGVLGDKDTFQVAFALAGKTEEYNQVPIGPIAAMIDFERHGIYGENPRYKTLGNIQLHPDGSMMFHHKTIEKIPAQGDPGYRVWPIDLVTTPLSDLQAENMLLGGSEWRSLGKGWLNWGFIDYDLQYFICGFNCSCNVKSMHKVEKKCTGKSEEQKEIYDFAFPVTGVKLPDGHLARKASAMLADAVDSLPEGGI